MYFCERTLKNRPNNDSVAEFISQPLHKALKYVRCGFELETQAYQYRKFEDLQRIYHEATSASFDTAAAQAEAQRVLDGLWDSTNYLRVILLDKTTRYQLYDNFYSLDYATRSVLESKMFPLAFEALFSERAENGLGISLTTANRNKLALETMQQELTLRKLADKIIGYSPSSYLAADLFERMKSDIFNSVRRNFGEKFQREPQYTTFNDMMEKLSLSWDQTLLDTHGDGSVSGPEIVTRGGLKVADFCRAVDILFKNHMQVDERCSFHIHISILNVEHKYGTLFQRSMLEYLLLHESDIPESCWERWHSSVRRDCGNNGDGDCDDCDTEDCDRESDWLSEYYDVDISSKRYAFIAYRDSTWEFRCFGNISNPIDAKKCLMLAIRAMHYAYLVKYGIVQPVFTAEGFVSERAKRYVQSGNSQSARRHFWNTHHTWRTNDKEHKKTRTHSMLKMKGVKVRDSKKKKAGG